MQLIEKLSAAAGLGPQEPKQSEGGFMEKLRAAHQVGRQEWGREVPIGSPVGSLLRKAPVIGRVIKGFEMGGLIAAASRAKDGVDTPEDKSRLKDFAIGQAKEGIRLEDMGERVLDMGGESIRFVAELLMTGGAGTITRKALASTLLKQLEKTTAKGLEKSLVKRGLKAGIHTAAAGVGLGVTTGLMELEGQVGAHLMGKGYLQREDNDGAFGGGIITSETWNAAREKFGLLLDVDPDGSLIAEVQGNVPEFWDVADEGLTRAVIEVGSEQAGEAIGLLGKTKAGKWLAKLPPVDRAKVVYAGMVKTLSDKLGIGFGAAGSLLRRGGFHGVPIEVLEEYIGEAARKTAPNLREEWTKENFLLQGWETSDSLAEIIISSLLIGGAGGALGLNQPSQQQLIEEQAAGIEANAEKGAELLPAQEPGQETLPRRPSAPQTPAGETDRVAREGLERAAKTYPGLELADVPEDLQGEAEIVADLVARESGADVRWVQGNEGFEASQAGEGVFLINVERLREAGRGISLAYHEATHDLGSKNPEILDALLGDLAENDPEGYASAVASYAADFAASTGQVLSEGLQQEEGAARRAEETAGLIRYLGTEEGSAWVQDVYNRDRTLFQKVVDFVKRVLTRFGVRTESTNQKALAALEGDWTGSDVEAAQAIRAALDMIQPRLGRLLPPSQRPTVERPGPEEAPRAQIAPTSRPAAPAPSELAAVPQAPAPSTARVLTEEQYLAQHGASRQGIGDSALHKQPGSTPKSRARAAKHQNKLDTDLIARRAELRKKYAAAVERGEVRPPTPVERRIQIAQGHPDNESTQAARRLLTKRGIAWEIDPAALAPQPDGPTLAQTKPDSAPPFAVAPKTDTPEFRRWFKSSVVTKDGKPGGEPLVVSHWTPKPFLQYIQDYADGVPGSRFEAERAMTGSMPWRDVQDTLDALKSGRLTAEDVIARVPEAFNPELSGNTDSGWLGSGSYFTEPDAFHAGLGKHRYDVLLSLQNPYVVGESSAPPGLPNPRFEPRLFRRVLEAAGYDGVIARGKHSTMTGGNEYVAFRPEQIKSATGNVGTFDPTNPDIRFAVPRRLRALRARQGGPAAFATPSMGTMQRWIERWQDRMHTVERTVEAAGARNSPEDVYLDEELRRGLTSESLRLFDYRYRRPVKALMNKHKLTQEQVGEDLYAQHAHERNEAMKAIDKDGRDGLSGMTDADANAIKARNNASPEADGYRRIRRIIARMHKENLQIMVDSGLIAPDLRDTLEAKYKHYVPLKTLLTDDPASMFLGTGRGIDLRGQELRRALGRVSEADKGAVLAFAFTQGEVARVRSEKAKVDQTLLAFIRQYPNPDYYTEKPVESKRGVGPDGMVRDIYDPSFRLADNVIAVKENGEEIHILFSEKNPEMALALNGANIADVGPVTQAVAHYTRTLAALSTRWNPAFTPFNAIRDIGFAGVIMSGEHGKRFAGAVLADVVSGKAARALFQLETGGHRKAGKATAWDKHAEAYRAGGGPISFADLNSVTDAMRKMERDISRMNPHGLAQGMEWVRAFGGAIGTLNDIVENQTRFSAYVHAVDDLGMGNKEALSYAKNLTTNFETKGTIGGILNAWWMFANAGIQGMARGAEGLAKPGVQKLVAQAMLGSILLDILNRAVSGDDDDDENAYDAIPEYEKKHNIVIMVPGTTSAVHIPAPFIFRWFHYAGTKIGASLFGPDSPGKASYLVGAALFDEINPLGGEDLLGTLTPTVGDLPLQSARNEGWSGHPIAPTELPWDKKADSARYFKTVSPTARKLAAWMNEATGGDTVQGGAVDVSPETLEHYAKGIAGGAGATVGRLLNMIDKAASGEEITVADVPVARRLYKPQSPYKSQSEYWDNVQAVETLVARVEAAQGAGDHARAASLRMAEPLLWRLRERVKTAEKARKSLAKRTNAEDLLQRHYSAFNRLFNK